MGGRPRSAGDGERREVIETDDLRFLRADNARLAENVRELVAEAKTLRKALTEARAARGRVLDWIADEACSCDPTPDDPAAHEATCAGTVERCLTGCDDCFARGWVEWHRLTAQGRKTTREACRACRGTGRGPFHPERDS